MKKYHSKPAQQATYIRVYEGDRRLQGAEVISVIHGLQAEVEQQTQRAEKAEGDLAKANERESVLSCHLDSYIKRCAELEKESLAFRSILDQSNRFHPNTDKMYSSGFKDAMRLFEDIYLGGAQQALNKFAIEQKVGGYYDSCIESGMNGGQSSLLADIYAEQLRKEQE